MGHSTTVHKLCVNRNQTYLASASVDAVVSIWRIEDGDLALCGRMYDFKWRITDLNMSRDHSNLLVVSGDDGKIVIYNMVNRTSLRTMFHPQRSVVHQALLTLYPLAALVLVSKETNTVLIYSVNGQMLSSYTPPGQIETVAIGTDGCFCDFLVDSLDSDSDD